MNFNLYTKKPSGWIKKAGICLGLFALASTATSYAQEHNHATCGNELHKMAMENPSFWDEYQQFVTQLQQFRSQDLPVGTIENGVRVIPVVVHVLHEGGAENISRNQILSQFTILNQDFRLQNPNANTIPPFFDSLAADCNIEFRLATIDPFGNCTDGVNRVYTNKTNDARDFSGFKRLSYWDRSKYLNVWVVRSIFDDGNEFGSVLGYAQFPFAFGGQFPLTSTDGITVIHNRFGTNGTASGTFGRTTTHEIGHWLGLFHIWGDATCGDDQVDDTPIAREPNFGCFSFPKEATCVILNENSTAADTARRFDIGEMFNNYMDYSEDFCMSMFSKGQKEVMDMVFSTYQFRGNLVTESNLIATGTNDGAAACTPKPSADFWSRNGTNEIISMKMICAGDNIDFSNGTYGGAADTYTWTFEGGNPSTVNTAAANNITYDTPGLYDVTLQTSNAQGNSTKVREDYVRVSSTTADEVNYIYVDDFESDNSNYVNNKWITVNDGNESTTWDQANAGYLSYKSIRARNTNGVRNEQDFIISPSYDLTSFGNDQMSFMYAYAKRTNSPFVDQPDRLEVYTSTNCGETWTKRPITVDGSNSATLEGNRLLTAGLYPDGFVPSQPSHWKKATVNISSVANASNVRFMFVFTSGGPFGNDLYIDDLNIFNGATVGLEDEVTGQNGFKVFPNPVAAQSQIYFQLANDAQDVNISVLDITGRVIANVYSGSLTSGEQYFTINNTQFHAAGIYFVRLLVDGKVSTQKIVVE